MSRSFSLDRQKREALGDKDLHWAVRAVYIVIDSKTVIYEYRQNEIRFVDYAIFLSVRHRACSASSGGRFRGEEKIMTQDPPAR